MRLGTRESDFVATFRDLLKTGDLDPLYPFLATLFERNPRMDKLWFTQLYAAYYRVDSAYQVWKACKRRDTGDLERPGLDRASWINFPIAMERRNLRLKNRLVEHLMALRSTDEQYWLYGPDTSPWQQVYDKAEAIPNNGPWAAFKWTDLARYVLGWKLGPTPPSVASGKGPTQGLELLHLDHDHGLEELGVILQLAGIDQPWDRVETALCKWHSILTNHYHLGQDLHELREMVEPFGELRDTYVSTVFPL